MTRDQLPTYERPPVIEVVIGVQFAPNQKLTNTLLHLFCWERLRNGWELPTEAAPLAFQFETFDEGPTPLAFQFATEALLESAPVRLLVRNATGTRLIQLQNGRLHLNWTREPTDEPYPRYETIAGEFFDLFNAFVEFLLERGISQPSQQQWEVTYMNHIPSGTVWGAPGEWMFFRPLAPVEGIDELTRVESFSGEWHFEIVPKQGRLHVSFRHGTIVHGTVAEPPGPAIVLGLTARGPVTQTLRDGMNCGHRAIVRTFTDLSSGGASEFWGLKK